MPGLSNDPGLCFVKEFFVMKNLLSGFFSVNQIVVITLELSDLSLKSSILVLTFDIVYRFLI